MNFVVPFTVIPLTKFLSSELKMGPFRLSNQLQVICWACSGIAIFLNVLALYDFFSGLEAIPKWMSFVIGSGTVGVYFAMSYYLIVRPVKVCRLANSPLDIFILLILELTGVHLFFRKDSSLACGSTQRVECENLFWYDPSLVQLEQFIAELPSMLVMLDRHLHDRDATDIYSYKSCASKLFSQVGTAGLWADDKEAKEGQGVGFWVGDLAPTPNVVRGLFTGGACFVVIIAVLAFREAGSIGCLMDHVGVYIGDGCDIVALRGRVLNSPPPDATGVPPEASELDLSPVAALDVGGAMAMAPAPIEDMVAAEPLLTA